MDDEKTVILTFQCPGCSETASPSYTKRQLEAALEVGEINVYHSKCDHHWKQKLVSDDRTRIKKTIERDFS